MQLFNGILFNIFDILYVIKSPFITLIRNKYQYVQTKLKNDRNKITSNLIIKCIKSTKLIY